MAVVTLYVDALAPETLDILVPVTADFNPLTASAPMLACNTSHFFDGADPHEHNHDWALEVVSVSASVWHLRHAFVTGDVARTGIHILSLSCTTPAGTRRWRSITATVVEP